MGFIDSHIRWHDLFLSNRSFRVKLNSYFSKSFSSKSAVPQGSVSSPCESAKIMYSVYGQQNTRLHVRYPYEQRCHLLNLDSLEKRRHISQIMFVASLISNAVDSQIILSSLHFYVPTRSLRPCAPLFIPNRRTSVGLNDALLRAVRFFNSCAHLFDHHLSSPSPSFRSILRANI